MDRLNVRIEKALARFTELTESRTSEERIRRQLMEALQRWFVLGREAAKSAGDLEPTGDPQPAVTEEGGAVKGGRGGRVKP